MKSLKGWGLALSGGGYRASLFHLGVTRRLHEFGILQKTTRISTVSGGSIYAGFLADRMLEAGRKSLAFDDWQAEISTPFREFVSKDIRTGLFLRHIGWNWLAPGPRAKGLEKAFRKRLTKRRLVELPKADDGIEFLFLATDVKRGVLWRFTSQVIGDYRSGTDATPADMPIALAVAASAGFPPVFGPIEIKRAGKETAHLTDGGVYDNTGMEPVWDENKVVLVSDAGAPFVETVPKWYGSRLGRYMQIGLNQVGAQRRRALIKRLRAGYRTVREFEPGDPELAETASPCSLAGQAGCAMENLRFTDKPDGAYWRLESRLKSFMRGADDTPRQEVEALQRDWYGYGDDSEARAMIAGIRTDLDTFTRAESAILENHGYFLADIAIRRHARGIADLSAPFRVPNPEYLEESVVKEALKTSHSRLHFWRRALDKD